MRVDHIPCGPFVNASEEQAFNHLSNKLKTQPGEDRFVILTNVAHAVTSGAQADEIDMVIVGSTGIHVIEVKHWDRSYLKSNRLTLEDEADKIASKVRKVATKVRRFLPEVGFITPKILLTKESKTVQRDFSEPIRGVRLFALADWRALVELDALGTIPAQHIHELCHAIVPKSRVPLSGDLRKLGRITDMHLLSPREDRFHRVYRGRDSIYQDRLIVHLYDLSAATHANPRNLAEREFKVIQGLQKSPWLPRLVDSFQELPHYPGELCFFTLADSDAPTLSDIAADAHWSLEHRIEFARKALLALHELHFPSDDAEKGVIHRTITPDVIRVRMGNQPLFFDWRWAKLPEHLTVSGDASASLSQRFSAPELLAGGLAAADRRSDVYALCASLLLLFEGDAREPAQQATLILRKGMGQDPASRPELRMLAEALATILAPHLEATEERGEVSIPVQLWAEDAVVEVEDGHSYRIVCQLGSGGAGRTFKMQQVKRDSQEEFGTYVAKVVSNPALGDAALRAYMRARPHTKHPHLAGIYWTSPGWQADKVLALLEWIEGTPLSDYAGVLDLYAEDLGESDFESLLLGWIKELCEALSRLHEVGLVHGDISPSNIIVNGSHLTLIDYDLVTEIGHVAAGTGTPPFCSLNFRDRKPIALSDDLFALAATFFQVLTERDPFLFKGVRAYDRGLAWTEDERAAYPRLVSLLDRVVSFDPVQQFTNAVEAAVYLAGLLRAEVPVVTNGGAFLALTTPFPLTPNEVPWLKEILKSYPSSRYGNTETRGLDSEFAERTYVTTALDTVLSEEIRAGRASLVILCGNAGDGKTAFLQHLAVQLDLPHFPSSERIWETQLPNGIRVKANLDGAAAWRDRSADDLLDEIFAPFHGGSPAFRIVHLVAVNDGRLMEWIEHYEAQHGPSPLTEQLIEALGEKTAALDPHIRLIELNLRSLVGGIDDSAKHVSTNFLDNLIVQLVGGEEARHIWKPCYTCSAQNRCTAWQSARLLGASEHEADQRQGNLLRERLTLALQAVHQRNEVHITTRELKASLSYILFGTHYCTDRHNDPALVPEVPWDLAFDPESPLRHGGLLKELTFLDPAMEAHPRIDRYLQGNGGPHPEHGAPRYPELSLKSARRRAYFEWTDTQIQAVGGAPQALGLARGRQFRKFCDFPLLPTDEQMQVCRSLCGGISRLEELPPFALRRPGVVPIRIVPRTPAETAFWVEKPFERFHLVAEDFIIHAGLETLHRHLILSYTTDDGRTESLIVPLELFALLMDLCEGVQLVDTFSDDVFANLTVFTQRLAQEDETRLMAWNPMEEDKLYELSIQSSSAGQVIQLAVANT